MEAFSSEIARRRAAKEPLKDPVALRVAAEVSLERSLRELTAAIDRVDELHELHARAELDERNAPIAVNAPTQLGGCGAEPA
jgi:hypothetical protein